MKPALWKWSKKWGWSCFALLLLGFPSVAAAANGVELNSGDTAFIFISSALVMLMTPGLGLVLRRHGQAKKRFGNHHAELHRRRPH